MPDKASVHWTGLGGCACACRLRRFDVRICGEFFTALYPEAADGSGMPLLERFPMRL